MPEQLGLNLRPTAREAWRHLEPEDLDTAQGREEWGRMTDEDRRRWARRQAVAMDRDPHALAVATRYGHKGGLQVPDQVNTEVVRSFALVTRWGSTCNGVMKWRAERLPINGERL